MPSGRTIKKGFASPKALLAGFMLFVAACEQTTVPASTPVSEPISRSADSLSLERYYSSIQSRLTSQGLLRTDGGGIETPITSRQLAENFERIALYDEYTLVNGRFIARQTPSHLRRWQRPIRIGIIFGDQVTPARKAKDTANVTSYARRLARLTGLDIKVTGGSANFHILFLNHDEQKSIGPLLEKRVPGLSREVVREISNPPRSTFCVAYAFSDPSDQNAYSAAVILVKSEHPDLMRLSCIHEEMAQALGLANDSAVARPSIFNDDEEFALLTRHDELLLKMLYDKRLKLGMTPAAARPLLPLVAGELVPGGS